MTRVASPAPTCKTLRTVEWTLRSINQSMMALKFSFSKRGRHLRSAGCANRASCPTSRNPIVISTRQVEPSVRWMAQRLPLCSVAPSARNGHLKKSWRLIWRVEVIMPDCSTIWRSPETSSWQLVRLDKITTSQWSQWRMRIQCLQKIMIWKKMRCRSRSKERRLGHLLLRKKSWWSLLVSNRKSLTRRRILKFPRNWFHMAGSSQGAQTVWWSTVGRIWKISSTIWITSHRKLW